jgi:hypothetical protein
MEHINRWKRRSTMNPCQVKMKFLCFSRLNQVNVRFWNYKISNQVNIHELKGIHLYNLWAIFTSR